MNPDDIPKLEPGFYFDCPESTYFRLPYLSASSIKALRRSPMDAWQNGPWHWKDKSEVNSEETPAMRLGSARHALILEGEDALNAQYYRKPHKDDFPGALDTQKDLGDWLLEQGCAKSGSKADQIARILDYCACEEIEPPEILALKMDAASDPNKLSISCADWDRMMRQHNYIFKGEYGVPTPGAAEVTVIFDYNGVRCKARIDWLSAERFVDLKTFSNSRGKELERAVTDHFVYSGIDLQMCFYGLAMCKVGPMLSGLPDWLKGVYEKGKPPECLVLFLQTDVPNLVPRTVDVYNGFIAEKCRAEIDCAVEQWKHFLKAGSAWPWRPVHTEQSISIESLPPYYGDDD